MAHTAVDHLRVARRWAVPPAVGRSTKEGAALHDLPRDADRRSPRLVGAVDGRSTGILWTAAGLVRVGLVAGCVPVASPLPDIAGHVVETVAVRRIGSDRCGTFGSPRDFATLRAGRRHDAYSTACATCAGDQVREAVGEAARVLRAAISSKETRR